MARKTDSSSRPLSTTRQGLQKFAILCFSADSQELGVLHGGDSLELRFQPGQSPMVLANGIPLDLSHPLVPQGTARMEFDIEGGRSGW